MHWPLKKLINWYKDSVLTEESNPYDLDDEKFMDLQQLWDSDEFWTYAEIIDVAITLEEESLLSADDSKTERIIGKIIGLREAIILVDRILKLKENQEDARRRHERTAEYTRAAARSATFSSPFWRDSGAGAR